MTNKKKSPRLQKKLTQKNQTPAIKQPTQPQPELPEQTITVAQLLEQAKQKNPQAFGVVPDPRAQAIVRVILQELKQTIKTMPEGTLTLPVLGTFTVQHTEQPTPKQISFITSP